MLFCLQLRENALSFHHHNYVCSMFDKLVQLTKYQKFDFIYKLLLDN